jgi:hypothetical protein
MAMAVADDEGYDLGGVLLEVLHVLRDVPKRCIGT